MQLGMIQTFHFFSFNSFGFSCLPQVIPSVHQRKPQHPSDARSTVQQGLPSERTGDVAARCSVDVSSPVVAWSRAVAQVDALLAILMRYPVKD